MVYLGDDARNHGLLLEALVAQRLASQANWQPLLRRHKRHVEQVLGVLEEGLVGLGR
jgi:hypothetical protein